jgi:hypothetical protein
VSYITFDFETVEEALDERLTEHTVLLSILHPISIAHRVVVRDEAVKTYSLYRDTMSEDMFMNEWLENLSKDANLIEPEQINPVYIIGFKSAKFDSQLIIKYLNIQSLIGSESNMKIIWVRLGERMAKFIDIRNFIAGGTLDQFTRILVIMARLDKRVSSHMKQ